MTDPKTTVEEGEPPITLDRVMAEARFMRTELHSTANRQHHAALEIRAASLEIKAATATLLELEVRCSGLASVADRAERASAVIDAVAERIKTLEDARMQELGAKKASNRLTAFFAGLLTFVVAFVVWLVVSTFDTGAGIHQHSRDIGALEVRQDRTDTAVMSIQTSAATMTAEVRGDRQRQDDRFEQIKGALTRLESRRPR